MTKPNITDNNLRSELPSCNMNVWSNIHCYSSSNLFKCLTLSCSIFYDQAFLNTPIATF